MNVSVLSREYLRESDSVASGGLFLDTGGFLGGIGFPLELMEYAIFRRPPGSLGIL